MNAITISKFRDQLLKLTNSELEDMLDENLIEYINQAMVIRYQEFCTFAPTVYDKRTSLVFATAGRTVALPTDMNLDLTGGYIIYYEDSFSPYSVIGGKDQKFWLSQNNLEFGYSQAVGTKYNLRYTKEPTYFDPLTVDIETELIPESINSRCLSILKREVEALWHSSDNEGEQTPSSENAQVKSNRLS